MDRILNVLWVGAEQGPVQALRQYLDAVPACLLESAANRAAAEERLGRGSVDLALFELMPGRESLQAMADLIHAHPYLPVIALAHHYHDDQALQAVQQGAQDYLLPSHLDSVWLLNRFQFAIQRQRLVAMLLLAHERERHQATHDPLTGLPNRKLFHDRLEQAMVNSERWGETMALLYVDLDEFKPVNDQYGHASGDKLLQEIGRRLQSCLRRTDTAARIGGDEFTVILNKVSGNEDASYVAGKICRAIIQPVDLGAISVSVSCSIGLALYPDDAQDAASLLAKADLAMYLAKKQGRNNFKLYRTAQVANLKQA